MHALSIGLALSLICTTTVVEPPATDTDVGGPAVQLPDVEDDPSDATATVDAAPSESESETPEPEPASETTEPETPEPEPEPASETVEPEPESDPAAEEAGMAAPDVFIPPPKLYAFACPSKPCRNMTVAGIVLGSLALVGVGTGAGLMVRPNRVLEDQPTLVHSTRPAGLVTVTISSALTVTAVLMIIAARKGYAQQTARVQLTPTGLRF